MEVSMADKITREMGDQTPRDASRMGSNTHTALYAVLVLIAAGILGLAIYAGSEPEPSPNTPPATTSN
jgi:hypothetical protein